jgi:hypothetical protein
MDRNLFMFFFIVPTLGVDLFPTTEIDVVPTLGLFFTGPTLGIDLFLQLGQALFLHWDRSSRLCPNCRLLADSLSPLSEYPTRQCGDGFRSFLQHGYPPSSGALRAWSPNMHRCCRLDLNYPPTAVGGIQSASCSAKRIDDSSEIFEVILCAIP